MDGKMASGGDDGGSFVFGAMSKDELVEVELWERMIDEDRDTAEDRFLGALIRAAKAAYKLPDEADRPPAARSFEPRPPPPANKLGSLPPPPTNKVGSLPPPPPPPQTEFSRITVLALCAPAPPKNRTRKPPAARASQVKRPRCASIAPRGGAGKKGPELDHPHGRSLVQPRQPSTTSKPDQAPARPQNSTENVTAPCAPPHPAREAEWAPSSSTAGAPQGKIEAS